MDHNERGGAPQLILGALLQNLVGCHGVAVEASRCLVASCKHLTSGKADLQRSTVGTFRLQRLGGIGTCITQHDYVVFRITPMLLRYAVGDAPILEYSAKSMT